ncbi:ATP synthase gamma chain [Spirochaetia bacterium]|nr:ATP synthase gamma chain [Spirochaetia bacterium]GHU32423.1 ATP synthase gamma chain [Spirochaetia bacterium]
MANEQEVRVRIRAIRQTLQVTKAMNLISTSKLRKGRRTLEDTEPFFTRVQKTLYDIISGVGDVQSDFLRRGDSPDQKHTAVIIVSSDKGLAGSFNASIIRLASTVCDSVANPVLIPVGNIAYRHFVHSPYAILENFSFRSQLPTLDDAKTIADYVISQYLWGIFNEVHIVYTHMYSTIKLLPVERQILPLDAKKMQEMITQSGGERRETLHFEYLPSKEIVFHTLIPLSIQGLIYGCLVESYVSEQSARMAAMDESSKNAENMLADLQIYYNRVRQANITQEMTEISSGASSLE